ncbi:MAG: RNA polymerase sigma-70 factor [Dysgonomonas sp.]
MTENSDLKTFNKLYTEYRTRFVRFANSYVRVVSIAEDIATEAFMIYWENRADLGPDSNIPAYILTVVKNRCLNYLEHVKMQQRTLGSMQDHANWELNVRITTLAACNPEELFSADVQKIIDATLNSLPEKTLEVFRLSRYSNKSNKEIAEMLNITTKGVEFHITKALNELRKGLKDYLHIFLAFFSL